MVTKILFLIIAGFLVLGGMDYLIGNRFGLGSQFKKGLEAVGALSLNMIGIYMLAPILAQGLIVVLEPIAHLFKIDPSIIPTTFLAVDMGGLQLGRQLAYTSEMASFSGIILASNLGATLSFSIPVALGMIKKEDLPYFLKGLVVAIIVIPIGNFVGGLVQGVPLVTLIINSIPLFLLSIILGYCTIKYTNAVVKFFTAFSKLITTISVLGLIAVGTSVVLGIDFLPAAMPPLQEAAEVVVRIGLFLAGAYPMLYCLQKGLQSVTKPLANRLQVNDITIVGMIGALASNLLTFGDLEEMDKKGKVIASAFGISGGFMLGGQLAFVSAMEERMIIPFLTSKIIAGILSVIIAVRLYNKIKD
ncbi:ethanolamine utilization protein EutH [Niameybacter massiliensis]|uniref:ethanolamine utilization protein EutH n=1 Tax=Niameybacter massiliensis TaxID=1658108 RepID=UPI0006B46BE5|nr:ethanolamine utilization protein EutH [Niameybacter massiliensis]